MGLVKQVVSLFQLLRQLASDYLILNQADSLFPILNQADSLLSIHLPIASRLVGEVIFFRNRKAG
jgi:hypothetical protein